jgi:histidine triad (HIT) family protein
MQKCVFCDIVAGKIPATILYQDDKAIAFSDIHPQAPTHFLVIPKEHVPSVAELSEEHGDLAAHLISVAHEVAKREGLAAVEKGYRLIINYGREGGQEVPHVHFHVIGGRPLTGIMG